VKKYYPIILLFLFACHSKSNTPIVKKTDLPKKDILPNLTAANYLILKTQAKQKGYEKQYHYIVDSLMPYWFGTTWNFYGTTQVPQQGTIACGYFVTTILRDAHLPIQRIHLAQQTASKIINTTCIANSIAHFSKALDLEKYLASKPNNTLYILGLDCHVGFVIKQNGKLYFIQSGYIQPAIVKKELLNKSAEIIASKTYMIGAVKL
jgi:hypothetical protein